MGRKLLDKKNKKSRINITLPGWVLDYIDENRGETARSTYIAQLLVQIIKLRQIK